MNKPQTTTDTKPSKVLAVKLRPGETPDQSIAGLAVSPAVNAGLVITSFTENTLGSDEVGINELLASLSASNQAVANGDLSNLEAMLVSQSTALQAIFTSYARRAQRMEWLPHLEAFMGMALKAQAQSRATIQTLIDLKFPRQPATFVKQANIANGPQQVNNESAPMLEAMPARTQKKAKHAKQTI